MSLIEILGTDAVKDSRAVINDNLTFLDGRVTTVDNRITTEVATLDGAKAEDSVVVKLSGAQTIAGVKTFSSSPIVPAPTTDLQAATKKYVDDTAFAGSPNASETVKGIVEEATDAEVTAGTATGSTGAKLFLTPTKLLTYLISVLSNKTRVRAYKSAGNQTLTVSYAKITFESETYDIGGNFATSTFTAPKNGYYFVNANISGASLGSTTAGAALAIYKNGTIYSRGGSTKAGTTGPTTGVNVSDIIYLDATDTVEIYGICSSASQWSADSGESNTFVNICEI